MVKDIDHLRVYVSNIYQANFFYQTALGFSESPRLRPSNGCNNSLSQSLNQNEINILLVTGLHERTEIMKHVRKHGDTVKDIAFIVEDLDSAFENSIACGAKIIKSPTEQKISGEVIRFAQIGTFGHIVHTLIHRQPQYRQDATNSTITSPPTLFNKIDHIAICVEQGKLNDWVKFYKNALGFVQTFEECVDTGSSGMNSKVVATPNGNVKLVFTEPMEKYKTSQIQDYLNNHNGPGIQHIALGTDHIVRAVKSMSDMGISFLKVPESYYQLKAERYPVLADEIEKIRHLNILIDKDSDGLLYQVFSRPIQTRQTFFIELIQRCGCNSFGSDNIKMLFKAIEADECNVVL